MKLNELLNNFQEKLFWEDENEIDKYYLNEEVKIHVKLDNGFIHYFILESGEVVFIDENHEFIEIYESVSKIL